MWQAYYAKERVRLFTLLTTMLREQYHYSWATASIEPLPARHDGLGPEDLLPDVGGVRREPVRFEGEPAPPFRALHGLPDRPLLVDESDLEPGPCRGEGRHRSRGARSHDDEVRVHRDSLTGTPR